LLGLWDLPGHQWWGEALAAINLARSQLSRPLRPGAEAGKVTVEGAGLLGFGQGIPLRVGSLDHHVAAIGAGIQGVAHLSASMGTVVSCLRYSDEYFPEPDTCVGPGTHGHPFYKLAFEGNGTGALDWYYSQHGKGLSFSELIHAAESVPIGSDGLMARPSADCYGGFQGFCNLQAGQQLGHFVRSIMESTAASLRALTDRLFRSSTPGRVFVTGGGARSEFWPQMIADLLGVEVAISSCQETACLGAGMLAAVGAGWFDSLAEASQSWSAAGRIFQPELRRHEAYSEWYDLYRKAIS
jgi:xylulokinase